jgi:hypothetical protein
MPPALAALPAHVRLLLHSLIEPQRCASLNEPAWDVLIRAARSARLLGVLAARVAAAVSFDALPEVAARNLVAGQMEARFRRQKTLFLLEAVVPHLGSPETPRVLLKGAAYIVQRLPIAEGRLPADVDLMVPRVALDGIERALLATGWQFEKTDPYDQHYYRAWSHELPPMRCAGQALELDLHHSILPPLGRLKPDVDDLFAAAVPIVGTSFSALCPADQVLHAAAHLFQDSDCTGRLRDLVDIDGLVRTHATADPGFWPALSQRAHLHRLNRPLWYALAFTRAWLATPMPEEAAARIASFRPPWPARAALCVLVTRTLPPVHPDGEPGLWDRLASRLLEARGVWLRLPPWLLAWHAANKAWRACRPGAAS